VKELFVMYWFNAALFLAMMKVIHMDVHQWCHLVTCGAIVLHLTCHLTLAGDVECHRHSCRRHRISEYRWTTVMCW